MTKTYTLIRIKDGGFGIENMEVVTTRKSSEIRESIVKYLMKTMNE